IGDGGLGARRARDSDWTSCEPYGCVTDPIYPPKTAGGPWPVNRLLRLSKMISAMKRCRETFDHAHDPIYPPKTAGGPWPVMSPSFRIVVRHRAVCCGARERIGRRTCSPLRF